MGVSSGKRKYDYHIETGKRYEENQRVFNLIPEDQYLCPKCSCIPELKNVHTDNGILEFNCINHGDIVIKVDEYLKAMIDSKTYLKERCDICNKLQKDYRDPLKIFQYCYDCKKTFCDEHAQNHKIGSTSHNKMIPVNEKAGRCLEHFDEPYTDYCLDCKKNICEKTNHKGHNVITFFKLKINKEIIAEKNKILLNIIKLNDIILNACEKCPDNYYHIQNVINLAESITNENSRDIKQLRFALQDLEERFKSHKQSLDDLNNILKSFNMKINGDETNLSFKDMNLNNNFLQHLSHINFQNLKIIDISGNNFSNIKYFKNMNLSKLEVMNMSNNKIDNIDVLEYMNLQNLKELYLQKNIIKDVKVLLKTVLPKIKLIRLENNQINTNLQEFKDIQNKYHNIINVKVLTFIDFKNKYGCDDISDKSTTIKVQDNNYGDEILKDLSFVNSNFKNLKKLSFMNCKIKDISLLNLFSFVNLEMLDLSINKIVKIDVFSEMKLYKLTILYLNDNLICDITPLKFLQSKKLKTIDLKENKIEKSEYKNKNEQVIFYLRNKKIEVVLE